MINLYYKQTLELIKQNKLFTFIYVMGTGMAITTTMIMVIIYYVKIAPIYPEVNRNHTSYIEVAYFDNKQGSSYQWAFSYNAVKEWFYPLKNAKFISACYDENYLNSYIQPFDYSGDFPVCVKWTDPTFFQIYKFHFLEGKPFTNSDLSSGIYSVVITEELARRIFKTEGGWVGKHFKMDYLDCHVAGVVKSASFLAKASFAQVYLPYSCASDYTSLLGGRDLTYYGRFRLTFLTESSKQEKLLCKEINELIRKHNTSKGVYEINIWEQPTSHWMSVFQEYSGQTFDRWSMFRQFAIILIVLLLVPALNLSGMIAGRMESRLSEMGIRKSYGANRTQLLRQIMWENLFLTIMGGLLGLIGAWGCLFLARDWIFSLFEGYSNQIPEGITTKFSMEMWISPSIFLFALLLCVVLNLFSALIPACRSLQKPIIDSLNEKK